MQTNNDKSPRIAADCLNRFVMFRQRWGCVSSYQKMAKFSGTVFLRVGKGFDCGTDEFKLSNFLARLTHLYTLFKNTEY